MTDTPRDWERLVSGGKFVILSLLLVAVACASPAAAQQTKKIWRIGYMAPGPIFPALRQELRKLGYVEGRNLVFEYRQGKRVERFADLAKELVASKVDLIFSVGVSATRAAKQATSTIPIVMGNSSDDPVKQGLIDSLARPGGNVTGVFDLLPDLAGKRVELLKEIFPRLTRIAHLAPAATPVGPAHLKATEATARALGIHIQPLYARGPGDLDRVFRDAAEGGAEAVIVVGVSFFIPNRARIVSLAAKYRVPAMYSHATWVRAGGFLSYSTDTDARHRRAAHYVDKIFKGANPADLPVEQPKFYVFEVNLKAARMLGIEVPSSILLRADKVIE